MNYLGPSLDIGSQKVTSLATPTASADGATKGYVDSAATPTGAVSPYAGCTVPSGWLLCDGSAVSRTTYAALWAALSKSATITVTIATPGVVTWTAHGLSDGDTVKFSTTGALPTGITAGTTYYVKSSTANTFQISTTKAGASVNTSGSQSGTHTATHAPWGPGDGSTTFSVPDLRGRVTVGVGTGSGLTLRNIAETGGEETHDLATTEIPSHSHTIAGQAGTISAGSNIFAKTTGASSMSTDAAGGGNPHNVMQPYGVVRHIIKT